MKIRNNQKYLKDSELTLYINNCLEILHWSEFLELFLENFSTPYTISLIKFSNIRFKFGDDLNEYYQNKAKLGHALGPHQNDESWCLSLFQLTGKNSNNKSNEEPIHKNAYTFKKLRPSRPNLDNGQYSQKRPWNYRFLYKSPQNRLYVPNYHRIPQNHVRPSHTPQIRPNLHYQTTLSQGRAVFASILAFLTRIMG